MTYNLVHESGILNTTSGTEQAKKDFWIYFFSTFLPTKGWTVVADNSSSTQSYFLIKKTFTNYRGDTIVWSYIYEFEWSDFDVLLYQMPPEQATASTSGYITYISVTSSFPGLTLVETPNWLQIWASDQTGDSFFVKFRNPDTQTSGSQRSVHMIHFPDDWHNPGNPNTTYGGNKMPVWFASNIAIQTLSEVSGSILLPLCMPPVEYSPADSGVQRLTNQVRFKSGGGYPIYGFADDIMVRYPLEGSFYYNTSVQTVIYNGTNWLHIGTDVAGQGMLFDCGSANPLGEQP